MTPNRILNGTRVAHGSSLNCTFLGTTYTVPKVRQVPYWPSQPLNGRYVFLVEARDRPVPGPWTAGALAGVDRVVAWIDNLEPIGRINSIGGVAGCGDLLLSHYTTSSAEIRG